LRIGLMIVPPVLLWGALHFEAAARCVAAELQLHARSGASNFQQSHRRHRVRIFDSRARTAPLLSILVQSLVLIDVSRQLRHLHADTKSHGSPALIAWSRQLPRKIP
jgi:hypothetical protein